MEKLVDKIAALPPNSNYFSLEFFPPKTQAVSSAGHDETIHDTNKCINRVSQIFKLVCHACRKLCGLSL